MPYDFGAIKKDKEKLNTDSTFKRGEKANRIFSGQGSVDEAIKSGSIIQKNIEENGITTINIDLINDRKVNNFENISNVTLKASIKYLGLIEPIAVRTTDTGKFIVISGHRRLSAFRELVSDLKVELAMLEKDNQDTSKVTADIERFSSIPAIIFTIVDDDSDLLGTNAKYITRKIEEAMYQAANLERRNTSENDLAKNIKYFYDLIKTNPDYKKKLLDDRNKTAERQSKKLNMPVVIADILRNDLKFSISKGYITQLIFIYENAAEYPKYYEICIKRINNNEGINPVYKDFKMALEVYKKIQSEEKDIKQEYLDRMEKSDEHMVDIYNEVFNIKPVKKEKVTAEKKVAVSKVEALLLAIKNNEISIDNAIKQLKKM